MVAPEGAAVDPQILTIHSNTTSRIIKEQATKPAPDTSFFS